MVSNFSILGVHFDEGYAVKRNLSSFDSQVLDINHIASVQENL